MGLKIVSPVQYAGMCCFNTNITRFLWSCTDYTLHTCPLETNLSKFVDMSIHYFPHICSTQAILSSLQPHGVTKLELDCFLLLVLGLHSVLAILFQSFLRMWKLCQWKYLSGHTLPSKPRVCSCSDISSKHWLHRVEEWRLPCRYFSHKENVDMFDPCILAQLVGLDLCLQSLVCLE